MKVVRRSRRTGTAFALALAGVAAAIVPASAGASSFTNACANSVTANRSQITVDMTADATDPVAPGGTVMLTNIKQTSSVPGSIFLAGYRLGLLHTGQNNIPATVATIIEATNTVEGTQQTNFAAGTVSTTITDPTPGNPNSGDETATDGSLTVTYNDETWTAGASPGPILFREDTVTPLDTTQGAEQGGLVIRAVIAGFLQVRFACSPGTVTGPDPGTVAFIDPSIPFETSTVASATPSCFGVDGGTLTPAVTASGTAYVSAGVTTSPGSSTITGTSGPDVIIGTDGADTINAGAGDDKVCSRAGDDRVHGNKGADQIDTGADNDVAQGDNGPDTMLGSTGNDKLVGELGADTINGEDGNDTLIGGANDDNITGGAGDDTMDGDNASPYGPAGSEDVCDGGADTDTATRCEVVSNVP